MTFPNPLDALIPKIPFSFFAEFWFRVGSRARGVSLGRIFGGGRQLSPFLGGGGGGSSQRAVSPPPSPANESPPTPAALQCAWTATKHRLPHDCHLPTGRFLVDKIFFF